MTDGNSRDVDAAANKRELTEYEKGYLDGLLTGTGETSGTWTERYHKVATAFLKMRGLEGWSVKVRRV